MKFIGLALTGVSTLLLVGCLATPEGGGSIGLPNQLAVNTRIQQNGEKYSKLNSSQKSAVKKGSISEGMKKDAVRLAWGKPDKVETSSSGQKELWIYYEREQVDIDYRTPSGMFSKFYRSSNKYYDGHSNSELRTVQRMDRTVSFYKGRVLAWTRTRH